MSNGAPFRKAGILLVGTVAAWSITALPIGLLFGGSPLIVSVAAAWLCLVTGMIVFFVADSLEQRSPEVKIVAVVLATAVRMGGVVSGGLVLYYKVEVVREHGMSFVSWAIVFYLVALAIETGLLMSAAVGAPRALKDGN